MSNSNSMSSIAKQKPQQDLPELPVGQNNHNNNNNNGGQHHETNTNLVQNGSSNSSSRSTKSSTTPLKKYQTITKHKGEFSLELNDDDDDRNGDIHIKLTAHQDLDDLLNQPVGMPPPRKNINTYSIG